MAQTGLICFLWGFIWWEGRTGSFASHFSGGSWEISKTIFFFFWGARHRWSGRGTIFRYTLDIFRYTGPCPNSEGYPPTHCFLNSSAPPILLVLAYVQCPMLAPWVTGLDCSNIVGSKTSVAWVGCGENGHTKCPPLELRQHSGVGELITHFWDWDLLPLAFLSQGQDN